MEPVGVDDIEKIIKYNRREFPRLQKEYGLPVAKRGDRQNSKWVGIRSELGEWNVKHIKELREKTI